MKYSAEPLGGEKPQSLPDSPSADYLREALLDTMSQHDDIHFDFKIQVRGKNEGELGIEDATTVWNEEDTPFVTVASITIHAPQTEVSSASHVEACENLVFTPWHSVLDHQPLGSINRLRKAVYMSSADHRRPESSGQST